MALAGSVARSAAATALAMAAAVTKRDKEKGERERKRERDRTEKKRGKRTGQRGERKVLGSTTQLILVCALCYSQRPSSGEGGGLNRGRAKKT